MPRSKRIIAEEVTYHVYSRCRGKQNLLCSKYGKIYFIKAIQMCQEKYNFELIAAEPVGNHIHLIIRTLKDEESISRIMQYIKARIAESYNTGNNQTGPFWNERFGSTIIEESDNPENYLLWLLWYIGYNPVRKGLSRNPRENDIGFINCYLKEKHNISVKITLHQFYLKLGDSFEERVKKFLFFEDALLKRLAICF